MKNILFGLLFVVSSVVLGQTLSKTLFADPVTTYTDASLIPAGKVVTYNLEHRLCGTTNWAVIAPNLTVPSSLRTVDAQCHEYEMTATVDGIVSPESNIVQIDNTPKKQPAAPVLKVQ